jgi:hypothetical protein
MLLDAQFATKAVQDGHEGQTDERRRGGSEQDGIEGAFLNEIK